MAQQFNLKQQQQFASKILDIGSESHPDILSTVWLVLNVMNLKHLNDTNAMKKVLARLIYMYVYM